MKLDLAKKLRGMKRGDTFQIRTPQERVRLLRDADALRRAGVIEVNISTRAIDGGGFDVVAL